MRFLALFLTISLMGCGANSTQRVHDRVERISPENERSLERHLEMMHREAGIDVQVLLADVPFGESLEGFANRSFEELDVGDGTADRRGALFVYDLTSERMRIEVSYSLEDLLPDAFVGYLVNDHARYLFDANQPTLALIIATRMLRYRIRSAQLGGRFDPEVIELLRTSRFASGGAGASGEAPLGRRELAPFQAPTHDMDRFNAGTSVEETYQRYLDWVATGNFDTRAQLFTPKTRKWLVDLPMTLSYLDHILFKEYGSTYKILERGEVALLYSTSDPFMAPHFFQKTAQGWQMDLIAEVQEITNYAGGAYSWQFRDSTAPRVAPFADQLVSIDGFVRVRDGDNRKLEPFSD